MIDLPWAVLQTTDDALMARQYMPRRRLMGCLQVHWHPTLLEPEWNRIRVLRPAADLKAQLQQTMGWLEAFGGGCVVVEPDTDPVVLETLQGLAYLPMFRHTWVLYDLPTDLSSDAPLPEELCLEDLDANDRDLFRNLFHTGFATYRHGPETLTAWDGALREILRQERPHTSAEHGSTQLVHCLARWRGEPAGIASYGVRGQVAGFYNLAVHPRFRRRGIGRYLMQYRRRRARQLGAEVGFLQTQEDDVLRWHLRRGAEKGPITEGWGPEVPED